jgi:anti-sigma regulatory factor (Ser/Thr protein kinase)
MTTRPSMPVVEASQVGAVRRAAAELAYELGFGEIEAARVALVATELGTNLVKHAREGEILLQWSGRGSAAEIELIALDRGPGIANVAQSLRDGTSSAGTPGTGLGAIRRAARRFDVYSSDVGTAVLAAIAASDTAAGCVGFEHGAVSVPIPGEVECGDGVSVAAGDGHLRALVVDGLGHGPLAAVAATRAAEIFAAYPTAPLPDVMQHLHDGLRPTRGAAAALVEIDARRGLVRFCGVGNVAGTIATDGATRSLVSHHGTLGHDARRIAEFQYPWSRGALLVLNSDGLVSHWSLTRYPGIAERASSLVAAVLYRDFRRHRDDATALVVRETS